jgi:DNA-binding MarR family transcriptional regulator
MMLVCEMMLEKRSLAPEDNLAEALERYLAQTLHEPVEVRVFQNIKRLPTFLERAYHFFESKIRGRRCVFLAAGQQPATPSDIAKHVAVARSAVDAIIVYAAPVLSAHNRARLIAQGVAFVVPGNQLYIPELAMDLREHFRAPRLRPADGLSPAAQAVLFHHLLHRDQDAKTASAIARRLGYSSMSIGRALDDLAAAGLAKTKKRGRERHLKFNIEGRALLEAARTMLRSPVRTVKYVRDGGASRNLKLAGESALANLTDLSPPRLTTYAVAASDWKGVAKNFAYTEVEHSEAEFAVETWSYDPAGLSDGPLVDPLSLYAQFSEHRDERVSMAAQKLLEEVSW